MVHGRSSARLILATLSLACSPPSGSSESTLGVVGSSTAATTSSTTTSSTSSTSTGEASTTEAATEATLSSSSAEGPRLDVGVGDDMGGGSGCSKIDFVFAIDASAWMDENYASLEAALPHFIDAIDEVFPNVDVHIIVANTSGMWGTWECPINLCSLEEGCEPIGEQDYPCDVVHEIEEMPECDRTYGAGVTFPTGRDATNSRCELAGGRRYLTREEPDLKGSFVCIASQGYAARYEATGWASGRALSYDLNRPGGCNEGFLREDAHLVVTAISFAGSFDGGYNPKVWADAVLDAKGGEQDAVSLIALLNDTRLPGNPCYETTSKHQLFAYSEYFEHRLVSNLCDEAFEQDFDAGLEMVAGQCDAAR